MPTIAAFIESLRPKQWVFKNAFIFAPMVFSLHWLHWPYIRHSLLAFALFSLITGCIYIFNDSIDKKADQNHPQKCRRPIASGRLNVITACIAASGLLALTLLAIFHFNRQFFLIAMIYIGMNLLYSFALKNVIIIDVMIIALGFVLRLFVGGVVNSIQLSPWILISPFLLSIFLALIKRRQEFIKMQNGGDEFITRKSLQQYSVGMIDQMISISTATTLIWYVMYVLSPDIQNKFHTQRLFYTVPFVIFGIFRFLFLSYSNGEGESATEILYTDLPFTLNLIAWLAVFILLVGR
jgi:4-hydroxybenzoate polyprenyltransferase